MKLPTIVICTMVASGCATNNQIIDAGSRAAQVDVPAAAAVRVRLPVGEVAIHGVAGNAISASVEMFCEEGDRGCQRRAKKAGFVSRTDTSAIHISLEPPSMFAWRDVHATININVPYDHPLHVKMGAGEIVIDHMQSCVELDMYAGDADIHVDKLAVAGVYLDVGTGDTSLVVDGDSIEGKRALLVGSELEWNEGNGWCQVLGDLQFGDLRIYLDQL
ncbi:MAG: hypothetical protein OEQ74_01975 [Gammaproteobacteria bacterium]|nr:hypothetical protein [Gammaproteobacteria bacterium]